MIKSTAFLFIFIISTTNCQFFYNYEEDSPEDPQSGTENYDQAAYQYNSPPAVNEQNAIPLNADNQPTDERGTRRTRIRVRSRNYQPEPDYDPQQMRQERRQARRRQRQNDYVIEPATRPIIYAPSIFEKIGLGEAPSGVYIPQDSFLNVLRNPSQMPVSPRLFSQTNNYVQPSVDNTNRYFVQPPSNDEPNQPNLVLPVTQPAVQYANPSSQTRVIPLRNTQARSVRGNRRPRPRVRLEPEYAEPPTVDIDSLREYTDDVARENVMSQVQYVPTNVRQNSRSQSSAKMIRNYQTTTPAPRIYSPSIFEKVSLGEAPNGVYVPEDSLLNVLRNPSELQSSRRVAPQASQPVYSIPNEYEEVVEEQYEAPPAPIPPRRRSSPRSRQTVTSSRSQRPRYKNEYEDRNVQPVSPSHQPRNQLRSDDFEDIERQRPRSRSQIQSQRKPAAAPAPRAQPQSSSSEQSQSAFRKAKLAIAELPSDTDEDGIPGEAGVNYPTFHTIPKTAFSCSQQPHNGYYADLDTSCQVVHLCQSGGVQSSFLCPNGTIFSQEKFSCQWWYKVNCDDAPKYYVKNDELYKVPEKKERKRN